MKSIADAYCSAKLANAFTLFNKVETLPGSKGSGEGWYKDSSFRQFKAFLYLSDVGENDAPFQVILKSNKNKRLFERHEYCRHAISRIADKKMNK